VVGGWSCTFLLISLSQLLVARIRSFNFFLVAFSKLLKCSSLALVGKGWGIQNLAIEDGSRDGGSLGLFESCPRCFKFLNVFSLVQLIPLKPLASMITPKVSTF
jgi:hypothetical protein